MLDHKKEKIKNEEPEVKVSYFGIYRHATCVELLATIFGVIMALFSAGGVCYIMVQFGELATSFVDRTTFPNRLSSYLPLTSFFGGGRRLINASHEENMAALMEDAHALAKGMVVAVVLSILLNIFSVRLIGWSSLRQITRIRMLFLRAVLRQDMTWFDTDNEFNLASKMSENLMKLKDGMGDKLGVVGNLVGTCIICLAASFSLGWELTLACISVMPFSLIASIVLSNYQTKSSIKEMEAYSQAGRQAEEVLKSVRTVIAFAGENKETDKYRELLDPAESYGKKRGLYTGIGNGFNWVLTYFLNAIGLAYGCRLIMNDFNKPPEDRRYIVGVIFSILANAYMATQSITLCVPHAEVFATARGAATSIFQLIDREPAIDSLDEGGLSPRQVKGDITLEDVHFSYPSRQDVKVLKGLSLQIKAGEYVALVGSSGCGKSTIIQLLQRLYDTHDGSVKLDGKDVKNLNLTWLRSSLGVVGQEPVLFRGTIHDNIAIGCPEATREDVQRVTEIAYAHDFICNLSNGYDTVIGERGASLSGGQKQRVAIARSLLREPAVLLLDEATSALDPHSERKVQAALDRASLGRTTISISHRLSTIVNADRIICMDQGTIVEQGKHEELMKTKGNESQEPEEIEPLIEESGTDGGSEDAAQVTENTVKKRSTKRLHRNLSINVTRGNESQEPEEIEPLIEESGTDGGSENAAQVTENTVKKRSTKRLHRNLSINDTHDWMTPRGSIASIVSAGFPNFVYNADYESEEEKEEDDEEVIKVSDWDILKLNAPEWIYLTVGSIAAFIQGACFPTFAVLYAYTSSVFVLEDHNEVIHRTDLYAGMFVVVAIVAGVSMCLQSCTFTTSGLKMTTRLRHQYFSALLRQEMSYYDKESNTVGAVCARLSGDAAEVQGATGLRIGLILQGFSSITVGCLVSISYNWKLTLVAIAFVPFMVGSIWLDGIMSQKSVSDERAAMEDATSIATEAVVSIKTVQSLGVEKLFIDKFEASLVEACKAVTKKTRLRGLILGLGVYVPFMSFCCAMVYATHLISRGELEYMTAILITNAIMYGAYMLGQALLHAPGFNSAKNSGARILSLIRREPKVKTEPKVEDKSDWSATGSFSLKRLEFAYPTRPKLQVLRGVDLKVEAGKTVALVGASGCGKSTILQLLQRFYDPCTGNIELDARDIRTGMTLPRLRRQLGVVQQEPVLFDRTLAENIAYGDNSRKVTMHEVMAAAKAANIHSFIVSLPKGYETNLGSGGAQLSGGQKQRVCIARALIRAPRLLLLDEATSALDANSERVVAEALEKAAKGRTCITIAHRLSTIKDADLICVLDKGRIVEKGTHSELLALKGFYWKLSRGQHMA